jgi:hypothetical protein
MLGGQQERERYSSTCKHSQDALNMFCDTHDFTKRFMTRGDMAFVNVCVAAAVDVAANKSTPYPPGLLTTNHNAVLHGLTLSGVVKLVHSGLLQSSTGLEYALGGAGCRPQKND